MGNKPTRGNRIHTPYNQMVEDATTALKDRPGSTQSDVFNYLEAKYEGRISPRVKKNLETVIRSVIKSKSGFKRGGGRPPTRGGMGRKGTGRLKAKSGLRRKPGRGLQRRKMPRGIGKDHVKKKTLKTLKTGKKLVMPGSKAGGVGGGHRPLLRRAKRGTSKGCQLLIRPKSSVGSMSVPRRMNERSRRH